MTVYLCIMCKKTWRIDNGDMDNTPSGSLCKLCLKQSLVALYRKRQSKEGNFDCFAKATNYCDQLQCKYRELCLTQILGRVYPQRQEDGVPCQTCGATGIVPDKPIIGSTPSVASKPKLPPDPALLQLAGGRVDYIREH